MLRRMRDPRKRPHGTSRTRLPRALALALVCGIAAAAPAAGAAAAPVKLRVSSAAAGPAVPAGFVGLATEYWNVENEMGTDPSKPDLPFEQAARNLAPYGHISLRIGGDSTDWTWWPIPGMKRPRWVRWTMTPAWAQVTRRLVADLDAHLIIGLNMEANSVKVARAEVHEIDTAVAGASPVTFELGNEPKLYAHFPFYHTASGAAVLGRPRDYSYADITTQWNHMAQGLGAIQLAGPGYAGLSALPYVGGFLSASHRRLSMLTVHTYPLKSQRCSGSPGPQESELFDSSSLQMLAGSVGAWARLAHRHGVTIRVDEMNSVTCGGQPGLTNSFGPALWALNILPRYVAGGVDGVNFQTRPYTAQNLIQTTDTAAGWRIAVQPEYYGLLAFASLTPPGSRILRVSTLPSGLLAWAVRTPQGQEHVVVTNVGGAPASVAVKLSGTSGPASAEVLRAGAGGLRALGGVTLGGQRISPSTGKLSGSPHLLSVQPARGGVYDVRVGPASAEILTVKG